MFTGIITAIGEVFSIERTRTKDSRFVIAAPWACDEIALGASICCSGVCLTVTQRNKTSFTVEASQETLMRTTITNWRVATAVNLERALKVGDELGGHMVSGHVDALAVLEQITPIGDSYRLDISVPERLAGFIAEKSSVTLDGISLTVNEVEKNQFSVNIIAHTWQNTTLSQTKPQEHLNIEVDMLARYVHRLLQMAEERR